MQTGLVGTTGTEITAGLAEGDTLVVPTATDADGGHRPPAAGLGGLGGGR